MAILAFPLLLGCNCCDALNFGGGDSMPPLSGGRPSFTEDQVVGVWRSECGGKVSIREDGTYRADDLVARGPGQPLFSTTGTWTIFPASKDNDATVDLHFDEHSMIRLRAARTDKFTDLELRVGDLDDERDCRLTR
jgi:hypothetical protein